MDPEGHAAPDPPRDPLASTAPHALEAAERRQPEGGSPQVGQNLTGRTLEDESARVATFTAPFPVPEVFPLTPERLAAAGFYSAPTAAAPDRCACFACSLTISSWARTDDPLLLHLRWRSPRPAPSPSPGSAADAPARAPRVYSGACRHATRLLQNASDVFGAGLSARLLKARPRPPPRASAHAERAPARRRQVMAYAGAARSDRGCVRRVPGDAATLNAALGACAFRARAQLLLCGETPLTQLQPFELRAQPWHDLEVRPEAGARRGTVRGHWWLLPGSAGALRQLVCELPPPGQGAREAVSNAERRAAIGRACVAAWGGPWLVENCRVVTAGGQGLVLSRAAELHLRSSQVGGLGPAGEQRASSAVFAMECATLAAFNTTLRHCELYALRAQHEVEALLDSCALRTTDRGVGIDDDARVRPRPWNPWNPWNLYLSARAAVTAGGSRRRGPALAGGAARLPGARPCCLGVPCHRAGSPLPTIPPTARPTVEGGGGGGGGGSMALAALHLEAPPQRGARRRVVTARAAARGWGAGRGSDAGAREQRGAARRRPLVLNAPPRWPSSPPPLLPTLPLLSPEPRAARRPQAGSSSGRICARRLHSPFPPLVSRGPDSCRACSASGRPGRSTRPGTS